MDNEFNEASEHNENKESLYIYDKSMVCDVCNREFLTKRIRTGKSRFLGTDEILKPLYADIDITKYDVIACPFCGYAASERTYGRITPGQRKAIKEQIASKFSGLPKKDESYYTYDEAIRRCKMALLTVMVSHSKTSENASLCLRLAWLYRGAAEELEREGAKQITIDKYRKNERLYIEDSYKWFVKALETEYPPIAGMKEDTLYYLLCSLGLHCGYYEDVKQFASKILSSRSADSKLKEKTRDIMDEVRNKLSPG